MCRHDVPSPEWKPIVPAANNSLTADTQHPTFKMNKWTSMCYVCKLFLLPHYNHLSIIIQKNAAQSKSIAEAKH